MINHPNPANFIESSTEYGALGKTLVALSNLEFTHDEFIFKMHETYLDLSLRLSKKFPRQFDEKTDFLVNAVLNIQKLRRVPIFQTGEMNLLWLQYQLDEIYRFRSNIAHGSIFFSESKENCIYWTFERFTQKKDKIWTRKAVKISNVYLSCVHYTASLLKHYLVRLINCLDESSCWETEYQTDKIIRQNRIILAELFDFGVFFDENGWLDPFPPLGPVE